MGLFDRIKVQDALAELLDTEHRAAREGKFDILERLAPEKDRLMQALAGAGADIVSLERLRQKADHNRLMLEAMGRGVRAAQARLQAQRGAVATLGTYTAAGERQTLPAYSPKAGHRA